MFEPCIGSIVLGDRSIQSNSVNELFASSSLLSLS